MAATIEEVKNALEEVIQKQDANLAFYFLHDKDNTELSDKKNTFYIENKEKICDLIDVLVLERKLNIVQLYCLLLIKTEDHIRRNLDILDNITGINKNSAILLKFLLDESKELTDIEDSLLDIHNISIEYSKSFI